MNTKHIIDKARLCITTILVFFVFYACMDKHDGTSISIVWEQGKARGVILPKKLLPGIPADSIESVVQICLAKNNVPILGDYDKRENDILFRPLIAFSPGLSYEVKAGGNRIGQFEIPPADSTETSEIVAVYPTLDTLPENTLKFYILFSKPMQEGEALDHIRLMKNGKDTLSSVFLDLQPELWNKERTMLTLWFDPGRIKRGLQPNLALGPPLHAGEHYQLAIRHDWQSEAGLFLKNDVLKEFFAGSHDSVSPSFDRWILDIPESGSKKALIIHFNEALDPILAQNTSRIADANGKTVNGEFIVTNDGTVLQFTPSSPWNAGHYVLETEPRLEDLAGNNLNHLFDVDLRQKRPEQKEIFKRSFQIP